MGGWNPLSIDACACRLVGLADERVRLLRYGFHHPKSLLSAVSPEPTNMELVRNGERIPISGLASLGFVLPHSWLDAVA